MKTCSNANCPHNGNLQSFDEYRPDPRYHGGYRHQCKTCERIYHDRRSKTPEGRVQSAARQRRYRATEKGKRKIAENYDRADKKRLLAMGYVNKQIFRGKFPRASTHKCATCEKQAQMYHHHKGYDIEHRMDVVPLCFVCHKAEHPISAPSHTA